MKDKIRQGVNRWGVYAATHYLREQRSIGNFRIVTLIQEVVNESHSYHRGLEYKEGNTHTLEYFIGGFRGHMLSE